VNVIFAIVAAVGAIAVLIGLRRPNWRERARDVLDQLQDSAFGDIDQRHDERKDRADADLAEKRSGTMADRLAGALERARRRRAERGGD